MDDGAPGGRTPDQPGPAGPADREPTGPLSPARRVVGILGGVVMLTGVLWSGWAEVLLPAGALVVLAANSRRMRWQMRPIFLSDGPVPRWAPWILFIIPISIWLLAGVFRHLGG